MIEFISQFVARKPSSVILTPEVLIKENVDFLKESMYRKACFYNALMASIIMDYKLVIGYLIIDRPAMAIEHAWNLDEDGHIDLTYQFFNRNGMMMLRYHSIIINSEEAYKLMDAYKEVNHDILAKDPEYSQYFMN